MPSLVQYLVFLAIGFYLMIGGEEAWNAVKEGDSASRMAGFCLALVAIAVGFYMAVLLNFRIVSNF